MKERGKEKKERIGEGERRNKGSTCSMSSNRISNVLNVDSIERFAL